MAILVYVFFFFYVLILEREEGREKEKETSICCSTHCAFIGCVMYGPWWGTEAEVLVYLGKALANWATRPGLCFSTQTSESPLVNTKSIFLLGSWWKVSLGRTDNFLWWHHSIWEHFPSLFVTFRNV